MSGGLKEIRSRIDSVKNTQQITRAMKMVSAAKLKKAQDSIQNMRPYAKKTLNVIADLAKTGRVKHPLLDQQASEVKKVLLVVLTSDRGLCGGFNASIQKYAYNYYQEQKNNFDKLDMLFIGRKASDFFKRREIEGVDTILNMAREISYDLATDISERVKQSFTSGDYDEVKFIYNEFKSAISQEVICETIFPVDLTQSELGQGENSFSEDMIFEPSPLEIVELLLAKHFNIQVFRCLSESVASEHGARMAAMENSTKNAGEMINKLTLTYNKARQAAITTELSEITSGAEALN